MQVERRGTGHTPPFLDGRQVESGVKGRETRKETRERGSEESTLEMGDEMKRGERMRDEIRDTSEIRAENGSLEDGRELGSSNGNDIKAKRNEASIIRHFLYRRETNKLIPKI